MKSAKTLIFVLLTLLWCSGCSEDDPEIQKPEDLEDISTTADITPYGGTMQLTDESGNVITLTFPPGAIRDTTTITLTLQGIHKELPVDERQIRAFDIQPSGLSLYKPAHISIQYNESISDIEESALFRIQSDQWLTPLSDHSYSDANSTITANTLILGEFSEGKMTIEQINAQLDLLIASLGISFKNAGVSATNNKLSSGCEEYKAAWDNGLETALSFLKFFELREMRGYYDKLPPGEGSFEEDVQKVCSNIIEQAVAEVLKLGEPDDPCCSDYAHSIEGMMTAMSGCGSQSSTFDQLNDRYNAVHSGCHTYLDITTELDVGSGGLLILTTGEVMLTLTGTGDGEATVSGFGELVVAGSGSAGGECNATISGQTFVKVTGTRDAAYVYKLTVEMSQVAMMTTVCPKHVEQTNLTGGGAQMITLGPGEGFSLSEIEMIDEGTNTTQVSLHNPYIPVPDP
ncbi:MAG: hypothetical protein GY790_05610 [Bacteroidetes bacterium]|nr:hypothetical protein [Bacteroidota bacterium]